MPKYPGDKRFVLNRDKEREEETERGFFLYDISSRVYLLLNISVYQQPAIFIFFFLSRDNLAVLCASDRERFISIYKRRAYSRLGLGRCVQAETRT